MTRSSKGKREKERRRKYTWINSIARRVRGGGGGSMEEGERRWDNRGGKAVSFLFFNLIALSNGNKMFGYRRLL